MDIRIDNKTMLRIITENEINKKDDAII